VVRLGRASTLTHLRCDFPVQLLQTLLRRPLLAALQQKLQELVLRPPARHRSGFGIRCSLFSFLFDEKTYRV